MSCTKSAEQVFWTAFNDVQSHDHAMNLFMNNCNVFFRSGCSLLEYVDLSYCAVGPSGLRTLMMNCDHLLSLILQYCADVSNNDTL